MIYNCGCKDTENGAILCGYHQGYVDGLNEARKIIREEAYDNSNDSPSQDQDRSLLERPSQSDS